MVLQASTVAASVDFNILSVSGTGGEYFSVRGDGMVTVFDDMTIGTAVSDTLEIVSTIQGASPFVFEGG